MSKLDYETLHWGTEPKYIEEMLAPVGYGNPVGELVAISYVTIKDGEPTVYRHDFGKYDGRYHYLLEGTPDGRGKYAFPRPTKDLIAMGRVIDLELADLNEPENIRRVYTPFMWVCTTRADKNKGGPVILASRFGPIHGIEHRGGNPHVKEHGIIN